MEERLAVVTMSSKGQVVVPKTIRQQVIADAGSEFAVWCRGDCIILKKLPPRKVSVRRLRKVLTSSRKELASLKRIKRQMDSGREIPYSPELF